MNVNQCVKIAENCFVEKNFIKAAEEIFQIKNEERVKLFKNKTIEQIGKILENAFFLLSEKLETTDFFANQDNKDGADLFTSNYDVELKFGKETNANIGIKTFSEIFNIDENVFSYFNPENRQKRLNYSDSEIIKLNNAFLNNLTFSLEDINLSLLNQLLNSSGSIDKQNNKSYLKVFITNKNIKVSSPIFIENLTHKEIKFNKRFTVILESKDYKIRFILNNKNSYYKNNRKYKSLLLMGSPSFNVFVSKTAERR